MSKDKRNREHDTKQEREPEKQGNDALENDGSEKFEHDDDVDDNRDEIQEGQKGQTRNYEGREPSSENPGEGAYDDGNPVQEVITTSGNVIDTKNLPGKKRMDLVESGELSPAKAMALPANMPGKKLKHIRAQKEKQMEKDMRNRQGSKRFQSAKSPAQVAAEAMAKANPSEEIVATHGNTNAPNRYKVGDIVVYNGEPVEILEVVEDKIIITKNTEEGPKKVKVLHSKVRPHTG